MPQQDALLSMTSPLGADVLRPIALSASEQISTPFVVSVTMVSDRGDIAANDLLNEAVCVSIQRGDWPNRDFHGIVRSFAATGAKLREQYVYTAEIVPRLWSLAQTTDCRVFQAMSVADIITQIFADAGLTAYTLNISGAKPVREYITQYNETDLAFITRLMEEEGYFYFFEFSPSSHNLVVTNQNSAFQTIAQSDAMRVVPDGGSNDTITGWHQASSTASAKVKLMDYDPENPNALPQGETPTSLATAGKDQRENFLWPALTTDAGEATTRSKRMVEAAEARAGLVSGATANNAFFAGGKFTLEANPAGDDTEFVVRSVAHAASDDRLVSGASGISYSNSFTAFPAETAWREPRTVARPKMAGVYAGLVIGPDGQEIYTDSMGRIKVRFFWDHREDTVHDKGIWARVVQPWGGSAGGDNWGWFHVPRVGTEVAMSFMDGDPDRPVVLGCFYNGIALPLFTLPDEATKSGFRSRSSSGGSGSNKSELWFDDKTGNELMFLHVEKDMTVEVENDQKVSIDHDRFLTIKNADTVKVGEGRTTEITDKDDSLTIKTGDWKVATSAGNMKLTANADYVLESTTGKIAMTAKMGDIATAASLGNVTVKADLGAIKHEAMQSIEFKVGATSLKIDQSGISMSGLTVKIEGTLLLDLKGPMAKHTGDGMSMIKGSILMLN